MSSRIRSHIRSNVVGYIALFAFAVSGSASALTGTNTVDSGDIIDQQVKTPDLARAAVSSTKLKRDAVSSAKVLDGTLQSADLADNSVTGANVLDGTLENADLADNSVTSFKIADNSVASADVLNDTLTGADVNESTLGQVPSADTATNANALDGQSATTFNFNADFAATPFVYTQILNFGGLKLEANCSRTSSGAAWLQVAASTDTDNSFIRSSVGGLQDSDFDISDGEPIVFRADSSNGNGTILYRRGDSTSMQHQVTSVTFAWIRGSAGKPCQFEGTVIGH